MGCLLMTALFVVATLWLCRFSFGALFGLLACVRGVGLLPRLWLIVLFCFYYCTVLIGWFGLFYCDWLVCCWFACFLLLRWMPVV